MAGDADASASKPGAAADDFEDDEEEEEGSFGSMMVNIYYALMNLAITLGAVGIMLVAYWLFKWANVRSSASQQCPCARRHPALSSQKQSLLLSW